MLNCLFCKNAKNFSEPLRLLSSDTLCLCFICTYEELDGPYGKEYGEHTMIFWINDLKINVDGGQEIFGEKCKYFIDDSRTKKWTYNS